MDSAKTDLTQIEKDLTSLFENFRVEPKWLALTLGVLRKLAAERDDAQDYLIAFLEETKDLPEQTWVQLSPGRVSLL